MKKVNNNNTSALNNFQNFEIKKVEQDKVKGGVIVEDAIMF